MNLIRNFSNKKIHQLYKREPITTNTFLLEKFNLRTASSKAFALMLINRRPSHTIKGELIDYDLYSLKGSDFFIDYSTSDLSGKNIGLIIDPVNNKPSKSNTIHENYFEENFINKNIIIAYKNNNSYVFFEQRSKLINNFIKEKTECETFFDKDSISYSNQNEDEQPEDE